VGTAVCVWEFLFVGFGCVCVGWIMGFRAGAGRGFEGVAGFVSVWKCCIWLEGVFWAWAASFVSFSAAWSRSAC
jgi:hypothetical protein